MNVDEAVMVTCTDTDETLDGRVVRVNGQQAEVAVGDRILPLRQTFPGVWFCKSHGREFVMRAEHSEPMIYGAMRASA